MGPRQFVAIVSGMAIAIVVGGVWLIRASFTPDQRLISTPTGDSPEAPAIDQGTNPSPTVDPNSPLSPSSSPAIENWTTLYRDTPNPLATYGESPQLDNIVGEMQALAVAKNLPPEAMSIVLVDLNRKAIASYQPNEFHYPASVSKLFWLVAFYAQVTQGRLNAAEYGEDIALMVTQSDNNATSRIIDALTDTTTSPTPENTTPNNYQAWLAKRKQLNAFFEAADYGELDLTQKTYPITDIEIMEPVGFDLRMRQNPQDTSQPIRNRLTAYQGARLMTEIALDLAVSPEASQQMRQLLARDLRQDWQSPQNYFNPVQHFFGEGLPQDTQLYSKAGWTSQGRHEVAYVTSADGQRRYVLSVFADDPAYADNETFFPAIAKLVQEKLVSSPVTP
ncbi:MAG: serine hydrolase [Synechococcus sp.]|nr:serine hydrolase [Synechococcus sp.]